MQRVTNLYNFIILGANTNIKLRSFKNFGVAVTIHPPIFIIFNKINFWVVISSVHRSRFFQGPNSSPHISSLHHWADLGLFPLLILNLYNLLQYTHTHTHTHIHTLQSFHLLLWNKRDSIASKVNSFARYHLFPSVHINNLKKMTDQIQGLGRCCANHLGLNPII